MLASTVLKYAVGHLHSFNPKKQTAR